MHLARGARHGYGVARWIRESSDEQILVEDRALYLALHRLKERGWVARVVRCSGGGEESEAAVHHYGGTFEVHAGGLLRIR